MFHVGKGEFIDYQVLSKYVISMVRNGTSMNGFYLSLSDYCKSEGLSCSIGPAPAPKEEHKRNTKQDKKYKSLCNMQEYSEVHADFMKINENYQIEIENILSRIFEYFLLKFPNIYPIQIQIAVT